LDSLISIFTYFKENNFGSEKGLAFIFFHENTKSAIPRHKIQKRTRYFGLRTISLTKNA
jgi:hypothetical protein